MKFQPTAGYILVKPEDMAKKTASGIYLPDSHDEKPQQAKVLAVGPAEITDSGHYLQKMGRQRSQNGRHRQRRVTIYRIQGCTCSSQVVLVLSVVEVWPNNYFSPKKPAKNS